MRETLVWALKKKREKHEMPPGLEPEDHAIERIDIRTVSRRMISQEMKLEKMKMADMNTQKDVKKFDDGERQ